jgi:peptide/nickel transport system substrate-binding protein/microcin C transport system substrate-binding protein
MNRLFGGLMTKSRFINLLSSFLIFLVASHSYAAAPNKAAIQGGTFIRNLSIEPTTLHPIMSTDVPSQVVQSYVLDSLLNRNIETYEWDYGIAEKFEISKDNKTFTFYLRKDITFHDGKPLTAEDVKFSFDAVFEPKYNAVNLRPYFDGIEKIEIVDPYTVRVLAKDNYFKNFDSIATMFVIPKHVYSDVEKSKKMTKSLIGSGPYMLESYDRGQKIILKKFNNWYGNKLETYKGYNNYAKIMFKFAKEENVSIEMIKKGEIDLVEPLTNEGYFKKTEGPPFGTKVLKYKVENFMPKLYGFYGWNLHKPLFQDRNVRVALAHLMNREEMNKKFRYGMSLLATGPWYQQSDYASKTVKPIEYNPTKALELLKKSGWADTDKDGILDKIIDGKKTDFRFSLAYSNKDTEKYHTLFKEDLKKVGIDVELKYLEWNSFLKIIDDEKGFDCVAMAWGGGSVDLDPKQIWHSSSAVLGGSNFIGYKNPEVDKLIDEGRVENDRNKRIKIFQQVYEKIAEDAPYALWFNDRYMLYLTTARVKKSADTFKFDLGTSTWWLQP